MEKKVILEEIQMYVDQPPFGMDDRIKAAALRTHPLARSVLGTIESVGDLAVDQMRDYFRRAIQRRQHHARRRGRVDFDALVERRRAAVRRLAAVSAPRKRPRHAAARRLSSRCTRSRPRSNTCLQLADGPSATDDDRYAAKLLATIVGDDSGSRLYWELVDPGYCRIGQPGPLRLPGRACS